MRYSVFSLALALLPNGAGAETPLSGAEFDALTRGKTLTYAQGGFLYGMEEYLPNRRVRWSFLDGECHEGTWYEEGSQICFIYDSPGDLTGPQCWTFLNDAGGLRAYFMDDPERTNPVVTLPTRQELQCTGPEVGV